MTCGQAKRLFADHWSQSLSADQEIALEAHLGGCDVCRPEADRLGALWSDLARLPAEEPGPGLRPRFYDLLRGARSQPASANKPQMSWRIAAGIALLAAGVPIGYALRPKDPELAQLREEVSSMRQLVALSLLQQQSASERLRGVSWAYRAEPSDSEVLRALLDRVNSDPNVNVRLAAVDALHAFGSSDAARKAVLGSLEKQDAPLVQVAIVDLLVDLHDRDAKPVLRRMARNVSTDAGVRQRVQWALEKLQ
ncbi:MAG TPA: HEAT repeat domain-containing protein [Bryobacteraceae bacterium]|nr:HEAT repeat domain-containing protein [Bryobacteraceae bacterium]